MERVLAKMECSRMAVLLALQLITIAGGNDHFPRDILRQRRDMSYAYRCGGSTAVRTTVRNDLLTRLSPCYQRGLKRVEGCGSQTCGQNAKCTMTPEGSAVCSCLNLHVGDPLVSCTRVECQIDEDCPMDRTCSLNGHKCIDPCLSGPGLCGVNAQCQTRNHLLTCSCLPGHTGEPHTSCHPIDPEIACKPNPCGPNTKCKAHESAYGAVSCTCLPGYHGSPSYGAGCRRECDNDRDCPNNLACSGEFRCENPCKCGQNANCHVIQHRPVCSCPNKWLGDPHDCCRPECTTHSDCPRNKPACLNQECTDPCAGKCGIGAICELRNMNPICRCSANMTGDPYHGGCRVNVCRPDACGLNAICNPVYDSAGRESPSCSCPSGHVGDPSICCLPGNCISDNECPRNEACANLNCVNPCGGIVCGSNADCTPRRHVAVCTCLEGTRGDAVVACNPINARSALFYGGISRQ